MFRMYEMSTSTATCAFRQTVNAALATKRSSERGGRERSGSAARPAPITRREYRCEMTKGNDMRWLLLGATGLVGTHLRAALGGRDVVMTSHRAQLPGSVPLDLTDHAAVTRVIQEARPDVINVDAVRYLANAAPYALLVVFSSEYVFDGSAGTYAEDDLVTPINEYGRQKVAVEAI